MKPVFADTYYYLALIIPRATGHQQAVDFSQQFTGNLALSEYAPHESDRSLPLAAPYRKAQQR